MQIITCDALRVMPVGTIFATFSGATFGELRIKAATPKHAGGLDHRIWVREIGFPIDCVDTEYHYDKELDRAANGESVALDFDAVSYEIYNINSQFAIYEKTDLVALIQRLIDLEENYK